MNEVNNRDLLLFAYLMKQGGGGGTTNYNQLENKPKINGVELSGDKAGDAFGLYGIVQAESNTVVNGYQVPVLSTDQVQAIYNTVSAGKSVSIIDATEMMMFQSVNADVVSDEIFISFRYFDKMFLEYDEAGNITYKVIVSDAGDVAYDSTASYASGTVGAELNGVNALLGSGVIS